MILELLAIDYLKNNDDYEINLNGTLTKTYFRDIPLNLTILLSKLFTFNIYGNISGKVSFINL